MRAEDYLAMLFWPALYAAAIGAAVGAIWGLALPVTVITGIIVGGAAGVVVAIVLGVFGTLALKGGGLQPSETLALNGGLIGSLAVLLAGLGLLVWLLRVIL